MYFPHSPTIILFVDRLITVVLGLLRGFQTTYTCKLTHVKVQSVDKCLGYVRGGGGTYGRILAVVQTTCRQSHTRPQGTPPVGIPMHSRRRHDRRSSSCAPPPADGGSPALRGRSGSDT